jgi:hypothetical protein
MHLANVALAHTQYHCISHLESMAPFKALFWLFVFLTFINSLINCGKLNERRILLPYNSGIATNYTLSATDNGCYQW